jgi:type II restriction enzyme
MVKNNGGEWSEFLCFVALLLNKNVQSYGLGSRYEVEWIERNDGKNGESRRYYPIDEMSNIIVESETTTKKYYIPDFDSIVCRIKKDLDKKVKSNGMTFTIGEACRLMGSLDIDKVKSSTSNKDDFSLKLRGVPPAGYSVKSENCGSPSLLNAGKSTTRLKFSVDIDGIIEDYADEKGKKLYSCLNRMVLHSVPCKEFRENMGTDMTAMIARECIVYLQHHGYCSVRKITEELGRNRALGFQMATWKRIICDFLLLWACKGTPGKIIDGRNKASGGMVFYLVDGTVRILTFRDVDEHAEYLYNNSHFDMPSTTRHEYGKLYESDGQVYIDYVLGIRLSKKTVGL